MGSGDEGADDSSAGKGRPDDGGSDDNATPNDPNTTADAKARATGDIIFGSAANDRMSADGNDIIRARRGADRIEVSDTATAYGGYGDDILSVSGVSGGAQGGTAYGGNGNDDIRVASTGTASGDAGDDFIIWHA